MGNVMRKPLILLAILLFSSVITKAQDRPPPIIVRFQNKLIAVSVDFGTSQVLVELPPGQIFGQGRAVQIAPDSTKLVYAMQSDLNKPLGAGESETGRLFILNLVDGTTTELVAKGGVFDSRPVDHIFLADYTWSLDGTRIYFTRMEFDRDNQLLEIQIVYYDMATQQYHLVARTEDAGNLVAVQSGVMAYAYNHRTWRLYAPDNSAVDLKALKGVYGHMLKYEGQDYYALDIKPNFSTLINIETGEQKELGKNYYAALRSQLAGDQSLIALQTLNDITVYRMLESHKPEKVKAIPLIGLGERVALSPDGQWVAYLQFDEFGHAMLRVFAPNGYTFELPIVADEIYWGASETIAFQQPADK
jgi:hypothetical protein